MSVPPEIGLIHTASPNSRCSQAYVSEDNGDPVEPSDRTRGNRPFARGTTPAFMQFM